MSLEGSAVEDRAPRACPASVANARRSSRYPLKSIVRQKRMTVASEVAQSLASWVMDEAAARSGSSTMRCATRRSAGANDGSRERIRRTVVGTGEVETCEDSSRSEERRVGPAYNARGA